MWGDVVEKCTVMERVGPEASVKSCAGEERYGRR